MKLNVTLTFDMSKYVSAGAGCERDHGHSSSRVSKKASSEILCSNLQMKEILARIPLTYLVRVSLSNFLGIGP